MFCSGTGRRDAAWFVGRIKVVARTYAVFYSYVSARKLDKLFVYVFLKYLCNKFVFCTVLCEIVCSFKIPFILFAVVS